MTEPEIEGLCHNCGEGEHLCSCPHQPAGLEWQGRLAGEESHLYVDGEHTAIVFRDEHRRWWAQWGLSPGLVRVSGRVSGQTYLELVLGLLTVTTTQPCPECGRCPHAVPGYAGATFRCCGFLMERSTAEMAEKWWRKKVSGRFVGK